MRIAVSVGAEPPSGPSGAGSALHTLSPATAPPEGFALIRPLGVGAHGSVMLCRDTARGRDVAVTVLHVRPTGDAALLALHTELLAAAAAGRHPCTATVLDVGATPEGRCYLVGEWYANGSCTGPLPLGEVLLIGIRASLALRAAHRRGVLHLDVRPSALLRGDDGEAYLAGHGVARAVARAVPGAARPFDPAYAPRELAGWELPGPAADVYMLGATLYALLDGTPQALTTQRTDALDVKTEALYQLVGEGRLPAPRGTQIPPALGHLLQRMLAPHAADRPSLGEVHGTLCTLVPATVADRVPRLDPEPDEPDPLLRPDPPEEPYEDEEDDPEFEARRRRRRRWLWTLSITSAVLFAGGAVALVQVGKDKGHKAKPAASGSPSAPGSGGAQLLPGSQGSQFAPHDVAMVSFGESVQVAWQPPTDTKQVAGFLVLALDPQGNVIDRRQTPVGVSNAVFGLPRGTAPVNVCFTVTTLVRMQDGSLGLAPAPQVCPPKPSGSPSPPAPETTKKQTPAR
ncbi:serine/threonine-protein kinase [Yinghuangia seranimata]|uniref:serine/threonine-protein kinase n=1 Tax=Yinghuangia seranimata TaxID=408067 RepID=UPI00248BC64F|nr:serine/threonine-protein kinase [Yinghuangia seranimata]MDI2125804.1 serine/threonine-protein kinase [Yinghuangia seranimata]